MHTVVLSASILNNITIISAFVKVHLVLWLSSAVGQPAPVKFLVDSAVDRYSSSKKPACVGNCFEGCAMSVCSSHAPSFTSLDDHFAQAYMILLFAWMSVISAHTPILLLLHLFYL